VSTSRANGPAGDGGEGATAPSLALAMAAAAADHPALRDQLIAFAVDEGETPSEVARHLGLSRQQVYLALDRGPARDPGGAGVPAGRQATADALEAFTDPTRFERLAYVLLEELDPALRPLGGGADRGRDAVADVGEGDDSIVSVSLEKEWARKIRREVNKVLDHDHRPARLYGVTNRRTTRQAEDRLEQHAADRGLKLTVLGQDWLAGKLSHPRYAHLREDFLHLAPPRTTAFLTPEGYSALLERRPVGRDLDVPLVGRDELLAKIDERLVAGESVILRGAGGIGKTRLLLDLARESSHGLEWRFLESATPVSPEAVAELGSGQDAVVVIDNAHARADLAELVNFLERRRPQPRIVFVIRPGYTAEINQAVADTWLAGQLAEEHVDALPAAAIAELVRSPPFAIRFGDMVRTIVALAEGNPLIAILAARLADQGRSVSELTRDEVFSNYVGGLLASLTATSPDSRRLREVIAVVAALGAVDTGDELLMHRFAGLVGVHPRGVAKLLGDLADHGLLSGDEPRFALKPDLLAEHVLVASFFPPNWRPALDYLEVLDAFQDTHLLALCAVLGRVPYGALDASDPGLRALLARVRELAEEGRARAAANHVLALLPGAEDLVIGMLAALIADAADASDPVDDEVGKVLVAATQRVDTDFARSWHLLLEIAAASDPAGETFDEARAAMATVYQRMPVDTSRTDGQVLAEAQHTLADVTESFTRRARTGGELRAAASAGAALMVMLFESSLWAAEDPRKVTLRGFALPATDHTSRVVEAGVQAIVDTFGSLTPDDQNRSLEAASTLARHAAKFPGSYNITLDPPGQVIASKALELLDRFLFEQFDTFTVPIRAQVMGYLLLRRYWLPRIEAPAGGVALRPPQLPSTSPDFDEYVFLIHPEEIDPPGTRDEWQEQLQHARSQAERIATEVSRDPDWRLRLVRWDAWRDEAAALFDTVPATHVSMTLDVLARRDPGLAIAVVDELVATQSGLLPQAVAPVHILAGTGAAHEEVLERWAAGGETARTTLARAIAEIALSHTEALLRQLAHDDSETVRRGVLDGLRYGQETSPWRIELGLEICVQLLDLRALTDMLLLAETANVRLDDQLRRIAERALLATASLDRVDGPRLIHAIDLIGGDLAMRWAERRVDWLEHRTERAWSLDVIPDELANRIAEQGTAADMSIFLAKLERTPRSSLAASAMVDLIAWIDPGSSAVTDAIARHFNREETEWISRRLLGLGRPTWEERYTRAVTLHERLGDPTIVAGLMAAALPNFWSGSRTPQLQVIVEQLAGWLTRPGSLSFHRAVRKELQRYEEMIADERNRQADQDDFLNWD